MPIALQFAMVGEAERFLATGFERVADPSPYGFQFYTSTTNQLVVGIAGPHARFGVDRIGSVPAALLAHALIERFQPTLLINAGTAGGFASRGGRVGDVYVGAEVAVFHDRHIPLGGFEAMGRGHFPVQHDAQLAQALGLKVGIVSTGDSLDCSPEDARQLSALGASVKEMEAAAIAYVCEHHRVPLMLLKAITDDVEHPTPAAEQFVQNYQLAATRLTEALHRVLEFVQK